jgi:D-ribose pyranose/furanose isomerase RbsD
VKIKNSLKMKRINLLLVTGSFILLASCIQKAKEPVTQSDWKQQLNKELPLLGHRNWILVVDKAFPLQNAEGVITLDTGDELLDVLKYTLGQVGSANHIKPIIYTDQELGFITRELVPEIENYRKSLTGIIGNSDIQVMLHDSVFVKIDEASKLFKTLVLKTNETIPYSSVFIQLDCKYWSPDQESQLRELMLKKN